MSKITTEGLFLDQQPTAAPSLGDQGQVWVESVNPTLLKYTDNQGTDFTISGLAAGDVSGPGSSLDDALARFDGTTGKIIQNSSVTLSDSGVLAGVSNTTGVDTDFVTGTAGLTGEGATWNTDGDLVSTGSPAGDVSGPASTFDNLLARFDGATGKVIQGGHNVFIDDSSNLLNVGNTTGLSTDFVTGVAGSSGHGAVWNINGDLVSSGGPLGDVAGPGSSTDEAIARWDTTTGALLQDSGVTISDAAIVAGVSNITGTLGDFVTGVAGSDGHGAVWNASGNLISTGAAPGDVVGPASSTDNALARYDSTTGKLIQNSGVTLDDLENIDGVNDLNATGIIVTTGSGIVIKNTAATDSGLQADALGSQEAVVELLADGDFRWKLSRAVTSEDFEIQRWTGTGPGTLASTPLTIATADGVGTYAHDWNMSANASLVGYLDQSEMTAPAAPAADTGRLYMADVAGDTHLFFKNATDHLGGLDLTLDALGTGDVVGPASSTDEAVARFDSTTGKLIQNSVVTLSDAGALNGVTNVSGVDGTFITGTAGSSGHGVQWNADGDIVTTGQPVPNISGSISSVDAVVRVSGAGVIKESPVTLTDAGVYSGLTQHDYTEIAHPANPGVNVGRLYVAAATGGHSHLFFQNNSDITSPLDLTDPATGESNLLDTPTSLTESDRLDQGKTGVTLELKRLVAGSNITISSIDTDQALQIDAAAAAGEANTYSTPATAGEADRLTMTKAGVDLPFKSIVSANANLVITSINTDQTLQFDVDGSAFGNVTGPGSATDEAVARFDGATGELLQNSVVTINNGGVVGGVSNITGSLGNFVTGTAGADTFVAMWDANGNLVSTGAPQTLGDVVGPGSATDNALARFDATTGKLIQSSLAVLDDSSNLSGINNLIMSGNQSVSGGYMDRVEIVAPAAPGANTGRLYTADVGGNTHLFYKNNTDHAPGIDLTGGVGEVNTLNTPSSVSEADRADDAKTGTTLNLKRFVGGAGITITSIDSDQALQIESTGGGGDGDVVGPVSSTDEGIARFDGVTGKLIQNSTVTLTDAGLLSGITNVTGTDGVFVSGTAGSTGNLLMWDASGDAVDSTIAATTVGDVTGPASATDENLVRFDGATGKLIQASVGSLDDAGNLTGFNDLTMAGNLAFLSGYIDQLEIIEPVAPGANTGRLYTMDVAGDTHLFYKNATDLNTGFDLTGAASGDVTGPGSSTNNAITRFDGTTGKVIQNSTVTISDLGDLTGVNNVTGVDTNFVTGTAGSDTHAAIWNADGDLVSSGAPAATGDVLGPGIATDNAITRMNGTTGKLIQSSTVTLSDLGDLSGVNNITGTLGDFVTGTAGASGNIATWDASGNLGDGGTVPDGDVVGPLSATDEAVARFDTISGKLIQDSVMTVSDLGVVGGVSNITGTLGDFVTGTAGTSGNVAIWDAGGDLVDGGALPTGDVVGPAGATNNAVARFDTTTGKLIQDSVVTITDLGAMSGVTDLTATGNITGTWAGDAITVPNGGTGATTLTTGGILLGSGTSAITAMTALADGEIVVGDGIGDPVPMAAFESSTGNLLNTKGGSIGLQTFSVPAGAMKPRVTTAPATLNSVEVATSLIPLETMDFAPATEEHAGFAVKMPDGWDEGTITFEYVWSHAGGTAFGVAWAIKVQAFANGDTMQAALPAGTVTTDTGGTVDVVYHSPTSAAVTVGGAPAAGEWLWFDVYRDVANGGDTLDNPARLHHINVFYTIDQGNDA